MAEMTNPTPTIDALRELLEAVEAQFPPAEEGQAAQTAWAERIFVAKEAARALLAAAPQSKQPLPGALVIKALRAMDAEARKRGEMFPQTADEQRESTRAVRNVIESLEFYTGSGQCRPDGWPSVKDWPALPAAAAAPQSQAGLAMQVDAPLDDAVAEVVRRARALYGEPEYTYTKKMVQWQSRQKSHVVGINDGDPITREEYEANFAASKAQELDRFMGRLKQSYLRYERQQVAPAWREKLLALIPGYDDTARAPLAAQPPAKNASVQVDALKSARDLLGRCAPHLIGVERECCGGGVQNHPEEPPECCNQPIDLYDRVATEVRAIDAAIDAARSSKKGTP